MIKTYLHQSPRTGVMAVAAAVVDVESLNNLMGMGFDEVHARKALQETVPAIS